jgi:hypothetical protein
MKLFYCLSFILPSYMMAQTAFTTASYNTAGVAYTQSFDSLPLSGTYTLTGKGPFSLTGPPFSSSQPAGWQCWMYNGSNTAAVFSISTGSSTGNGIYSLGTAGSSDRALGSLSSSGAVYSFGLIITNQTGSLLNTMNISFTAEQWRKGGSGNKNVWTFRYKTGMLSQIDTSGLAEQPQLNFSSAVFSTGAGALNGNLPENRQTVQFTLTGLVWRPGEQLLLRWDDADEAGNDDAVGIDDFSLTATLQTGPPVINSHSASAISATSASLNANVHDNYLKTTISWQVDTTSLFSNPLTIRPAPDTLASGSGSTAFTATVNGLLSRKKYYVRCSAMNAAGSVWSSTDSITTPVAVPSVTAAIQGTVGTRTATVKASLSDTGGAAVSGTGFILIRYGTTISSSSFSSTVETFSLLLDTLTPAMKYACIAYATNSGGTGNSDTVFFTTGNSISNYSFSPAVKNNAAAISCRILFAGTISGLTASSFNISASGISGASVSSISCAGNTATITVTTGSGDGSLQLILNNNTGVNATINNLPFIFNPVYMDKSPPVIRNISTPNTPAKTGDTIPVSIIVNKDTDTLQLIGGSVNGFPLMNLIRKNDSVYTARCIITNGGNDISAEADVPAEIILSDAAGNRNDVFRKLIAQPNDAIDANKPVITAASAATGKWYHAGDTLRFLFRFSEKIFISNGSPTLSLTIGSKSRTAAYVSGSGTDSIQFRYIIPAGDLDTDGIRTAGTITLNGAMITDAAGNTAVTGFSNSVWTKDIRIDAIIPVINSISMPLPGTYHTGNYLDFLVRMSRKVWTSAGPTPELQLQIGQRVRNAGFLTGNGSTELLFRYRITDEDSDSDGITCLLLNNSASLKDSVENTASAVVYGQEDASMMLINPPTIQQLSVNYNRDGWYKAGDTIAITINYSEPVFVDTSKGIPYCRLYIGTNSRRAYYLKGTNSRQLLFAYTIASSDKENDGIVIAPLIELNKAQIKEGRQNDINPLLTNIPGRTGIKADGDSPLITQKERIPAGTYKEGDTLHIAIVYTETIFIEGLADSIYCSIVAGNQTRRMNYVDGAGTSRIRFRYIVRKGDLFKSGISISSSLQTGSAKIIDMAGNPASANIGSINMTDVIIDGMALNWTYIPDSILLCENSKPFSLGTALAVQDDESGEMLEWKISTYGSSAEISADKIQVISTRNAVIPNIYWRPQSGYKGTDSLQVTISDGIHKLERKIFLQVTPEVQQLIAAKNQICCETKSAAVCIGLPANGGSGRYEYQWQMSIKNGEEGFLPAKGENNAVDYSPGLLSQTTWLRRTVKSGGCLHTSQAIKIQMVKKGMWLGTVDSSWNRSDNWCGIAVPDSSTDVYITAAAPRIPVVMSNAYCKRITIDEGGQLILRSQLYVTDSLQLDPGSVEAASGMLHIGGQRQQVINGAAFRNKQTQMLLVNNPAGVIISDSLRIDSLLVLQSGNLFTNNMLTMGAGAMTGPSAGGSFIVGNVTIEKKLTGYNRFHIITHPFSTSILTSLLREQFFITGPGGISNGFDSSTSDQASLFIFSQGDSTAADAWKPIMGWMPQNGLWLSNQAMKWQLIPKKTTADPALLYAKGLLRSGPVTINLPKKETTAWYTVANPYNCTIDISRISRQGLLHHYWIWNPMHGKSGGYTAGIFRNSQPLPAWETLLLRVPAGQSPTLLFTEQSKWPVAKKERLAPVTLDDSYYLELWLETDSFFCDRILILQSDTARGSFDLQDAVKLFNDGINLYTLSTNDSALSIDARPISNNTRIAVGLETDQPRIFRMIMKKVRLPLTHTLQLHDRFNNRWIPLQEDSSYIFITTRDTNSYGRKRFEIATPYPTDTISTFSPLIKKIGPNPAEKEIHFRFEAQEAGNTRVDIMNTAGVLQKTVSFGNMKKGDISIDLGYLQPGIYLLNIRCGNKRETRQIIKQ